VMFRTLSEVAALYGPVGFPIGVVIVIALARPRFDQPFSIRSYTTAAWYYFALILYMATRLFAYYLLVLVLAWWLSPVLVALGLMLVVLRIPPFSWDDAWLRRSLRALTGSPTKALRFAETLTQAELTVSKEIEAEVKSVLYRRGYDADEEWLPAAEPMRKLWFKAAVLFHEVRSWEDDRRYRGFVEGSKREFDVLRERFDQLSLKVVRVLGSIERLGDLACQLQPERDDARSAVPRTEETVMTIVGGLLENLREDIAFFLDNLCLYVARGVLAGASTARGRRQRLTELGLAVDPRLGSIPLVLGSAFVLYVVILGTFWLPPFSGSSADFGSRGKVLLILMIATIQVAALATAIIAKGRFGFANEDIRGRTPFGFVIGTGATTMILGAPIQFFFGWLMKKGDLAETFGYFGNSWPWLFTAFAVGSISAWLVQDGRWSYVRWRPVQLLLDGIAMVAGMAVATFAALQLGAPTSLGSVWPLVVLIGIVGGLVASTRRRRPAGRLATVVRARAQATKSQTGSSPFISTTPL